MGDSIENPTVSTEGADTSQPTIRAPKLNRKEFRRLRALMRRAPKQRRVDKAKRNARNKMARASRKANRK